LKEIKLKTIKKPTVYNNYAIENYQMPLLSGKPFTKSTENWCMDGLINFEEPFSGLEELSLIQ